MTASSVILQDFRLALVEDDICPECLGELDTGWECNRCDFDAAEEMMAVEQCSEEEVARDAPPVSLPANKRRRRRRGK